MSARWADCMSHSMLDEPADARHSQKNDPVNISVSLTPELEELVRRKISSGRYHCAGDVVREALRRMEVHERLPKSLLSKSGAAGTAGCRERTTETPKPFYAAALKRADRKRPARRKPRIF